MTFERYSFESSEHWERSKRRRQYRASCHTKNRYLQRKTIGSNINKTAKRIGGSAPVRIPGMAKRETIEKMSAKSRRGRIKPGPQSLATYEREVCKSKPTTLQWSISKRDWKWLRRRRLRHIVMKSINDVLRNMEENVPGIAQKIIKPRVRPQLIRYLPRAWRGLIERFDQTTSSWSTSR